MVYLQSLPVSVQRSRHGLHGLLEDERRFSDQSLDILSADLYVSAGPGGLKRKDGKGS